MLPLCVSSPGRWDEAAGNGSLHLKRNQKSAPAISSASRTAASTKMPVRPSAPKRTSASPSTSLGGSMILTMTGSLGGG